MRLSIYSLKKVLFEGEAASVNAKTASGEITVLDHHRPLISLLESGTVKVIDADEKEHYLSVTSGFLEVNAQNTVWLLVEESRI